MTTEVIDGKSIKMRDNFRVYGLLCGGYPRLSKIAYGKPALCQSTASQTPEQAAYHIQEAGYATDPGYAKNLFLL